MTVTNLTAAGHQSGVKIKADRHGQTLLRVIGLATPMLAISMLLLLLGILLWLVDRSERERQRDDLIRDALWVEQTLEFHLNTDQENLNRLALDLGNRQDDRSNFAALTQQLVSNNPELQEIVWRDAAGNILAAMPPATKLDARNKEWELAISKAATTAGLTGQGAFSEPFRTHDDMFAMIYLVPIFVHGEQSGTLVSVFSLGTILSHQIPWWIAEKRAIQLRGGDGMVFASRSRIDASPDSATHIVTLGNFGSDVNLVLASYRERTNLTTESLVGAMILLGLVAIGGLLTREKHLRQRRSAEAALRTEHAFRKAMEDSLTVGVRARDLEGRIIYVNNAFCQMTGYSAEELVGRLPPMPYWLNDDIDRTTAFHDAVLAGNIPENSIELSFRRKQGSIFHALVFEAPLIDADGVHKGWMGSFLDITDRKLMEETAKAHSEKLAQTARLVTIGEVASLIAHDLNQPLAAITSYSTGLSNRFRAGDISAHEALATLDKVNDLARRAGGIVHRVQDFVKKSGPRFELANIGDAVRDTIAVYERETRANSARITLNKGIPPLFANVDLLLVEQVIVNLVRNAEEAMSELPAAKRRIDVNVLRAGDDIQISVADRGPTLLPETRAAIFTPFFTTKPDGMGIGLTICRSILEAHYGRLNYQARDRGGAVFTCCLPAAAGFAT